MNLADEIAFGFSAVEKGYIEQRVLGEGIRKWLEQAPERSLSDYLVERGLLNSAQVQELVDKYQTINLAATSDHDPFVTQQWNSDAAAARQSTLATPGEQSRFQIIKRYAQGGLGIVYLAHDRQLQRDVALKQIRVEGERDALNVSKFILEAEITGQLEHPGIVPVYALGLDRDGHPFYAMRFIRGQEFRQIIKEFHEARKSTKSPLDGVAFRQLLRRFLDVCNAIDYAHSRGILHRDLKPANVMIGNHGETLVVDWGLAKVLPGPGKSADADNDPHEDEAPQPIRLSGGSSATLQGNFSGTLAYASPEQLMGSIQKLCPASDVFSLGAILFELFTNQITLFGKPNSISQVVDWTRDPEFANARRINSDIPKPLAMICRKAMAFEIVDRYATARDLASDIERWLADERVLAFGHREPLAEMLGRLMRRYRRWTVPVVTTVLFSLIVAFIGTWLINNARIQEMLAKKTAIQNKNEAINRIGVARSAIDTLLVGSTESLGDFPAARDLQKRLLEVAANDYAKLSASKSADPELELERLRALVRVADIQMLQNAVEEAGKNYKTAIAELQAYVDTAKPGDPTSLLWEIELAKTIGRFAFAMGDVQGMADESTSGFSKAISLLRKLVIANPQSSEAQTALGKTLIRAVESRFAFESPSSALDMIDEALVALEQVDLEADSGLALLRIQAMQIKGRILGDLNRSAEAIETIDHALSLVTLLAQDRQAERAWLQTQADGQEFRAAVHRSTGNYNLALLDLQAALKTYQQLHRDWPDNLEFAALAALGSTNVGLLLLDQHRSLEAIAYLVSARDDFLDLHNTYPGILRYSDGLATALSGLGQAELHTNQYSAIPIQLLEESEAVYRGLASQQSASGAGPKLEEYLAKLAAVQGQLGQAFQRSGDEATARHWYGESTTLFKELLENGTASAGYSYGLAEVEWRTGELDWDTDRVAADQAISSALARLRKLHQEDSGNSLYPVRLAGFLIGMREEKPQYDQEADTCLRAALVSQPDNPSALNLSAEVQIRLNRLDAAKELLDKIQTIRGEYSARDFGVLALLECQSGNRESATEQLSRCRELLSSQQPYDQDFNRWVAKIQTKIDALR